MRTTGKRPVTMLLAAILAVWTLMPIYWIINMSFMHNRELIAVPTHVFPHQPTLSNYVRLFGGTAAGPTGEMLLPIGQGPQIRQGLVNSLVVATWTSLATLLIALPAAYCFGRLDFRGKTPLLFTIIASRSYPPLAVIIPFYAFFQAVGLHGTRTGLVLINLTATVPTVVWIMSGYFGSLPATLERAARIDGLTRLRAFTRVILPIARPGVVAGALLSFLMSWNEFAFAWVLTAGSKAVTFPPALSTMFFQISWPAEMAAASVIGLLPAALLGYLFQKRMQTLNIVDPL
jgi:multiple sugar transport system permease protein